MSRKLTPFLFFLLIPTTLSLAGLPAEEKSDAVPRALTHDDYDSWKSIVGAKISRDGRWILYAETPQDGGAEAVVLNVDDGRTYRHPIGYSGEETDSERAFRGEFSYDSTHVVFLVSPTQEELKKARRSASKRAEGEEAPSSESGATRRGRAATPKKSLAILSLDTGQVSTIARVRSFQLPDEAGGWLAYHMEPPEKAEKKAEESAARGVDQRPGRPGSAGRDSSASEKSSDLVLRSLSDGTHQTFGDVTEYRLGKDGRRLHYVAQPEDKKDRAGVYLVQTATGGPPAPLVVGRGTWSGLTFDEREGRLAVFADRAAETEGSSKAKQLSVYGGHASRELELWLSKESDGIPEGLTVSDKSPLRFSDDGRVLLFGLKEPEPEKDSDNEADGGDGDDAEAPEAEPEARFDLWHWDDPYPQPQQQRMARQVRDETFEALYYPDAGRIVQLADADLPDVTMSDDGRRVWAQNGWPYSREVSYDGRYADIWLVDPESGQRRRVAERLRGGASLSPGGGYLYWFKEGDWFVHDIDKGKTANVTTGLEPSFAREDHDTPQAPGSYGTAGWTSEDGLLLVYDRFDIWALSPDGSARRMITEGLGRSEGLSFRYERLDPDEDFIDPDADLLLQATDERTRAEGFYRDRVSGNREPQQLLMVDASLNLMARADASDRLLLTRQTFAEYPDLWVSDIDLDEPRKVTDLGSQTDPFRWGRAELRAFLSADGRPLKGILIKPDNYDPARRYPLMVYIYETLHQGLHRFRQPSPGTSINPSYYASNGYVLWMPDIEYSTGYPGQDALKCVLPGIHMLIAEGIADREAIGIQGHSWGGYQIAYMVTQTNLFAAAEAGAPVSNMVSAYGGIRWQSGMVRQFQYERTQSRLGSSLWEVPMRYIENSPIFWLDKVETPLLVLHNDEDGAVPWYQGIELIMGLRRLGKEGYMFNYNGEAHGLRKRVNQKDFTVRMAEFFDHHLRGAPRPEWMESGIQAWEKDPSSRPSNR